MKNAYNKIIKMDPNHGTDVGSVVSCLYELRRNGESLSYFDKAFRLIDPNDPSTKSFHSDMSEYRKIAVHFHCLTLLKKRETDDFYQILLKFEK